MPRLLTNSIITFSNPYVVCIKYAIERDYLEHRELYRKLYKQITGTWGYTMLHQGMRNPVTSQLKDSIAYFCFKHEIDVLQLCLMEGNCKKVMLWPSNLKFTIYEYD
jgi:hypothetical protein